MIDADHLLTPKEAAEILRTTPASLAGLRHRNDGPAYVYVGRRILYRQSAVNDFIKDGKE